MVNIEQNKIAVVISVFCRGVLLKFSSKNYLDIKENPSVMILKVTKYLKELRANAQKNRAKSENRGHSSKPNLPSFPVCNKVLMRL